MLTKRTPCIEAVQGMVDIFRPLALCVQRDANINCVITAAGCIEGLARSMASPLVEIREVAVAPLLDRLKERKTSVTSAIGTALDAIALMVGEDIPGL